MSWKADGLAWAPHPRPSSAGQPDTHRLATEGRGNYSISIIRDPIMKKVINLKPNFVCIGPRKTATTWLADHLKFHTDIWLTPIQELSYLYDGFSRYRDRSDELSIKYDWWSIAKQIIRNKGLNWKSDSEFYSVVSDLSKKGVVDLQSYKKIFEVANEKITGDISPVYASLDEHLARSFRAEYPETKIIAFIRDPVARFWSEYSMYLRRGSINDDREPTLESVISFYDCDEHRHQSHYSEILEKWRISPDDRKTKFILFDKIKESPESTLKDIVDFIGADWGCRLPLIKPSINRKKKDKRYIMSEEIECWLVNRFKEELFYCSKHFGDTGVKWREKYL